MQMLIDLAGWWYGALPLMAVGAAGAVRGARRGWHGLRGAVHGDASQLVPLMEGFRTCIIGLALVGIGAAWILASPRAACAVSRDWCWGDDGNLPDSLRAAPWSAPGVWPAARWGPRTHHPQAAGLHGRARQRRHGHSSRFWEDVSQVTGPVTG